MKETQKDTEMMEKIVSLCKRRGFVYQGSEIYGGFAGSWDYGPLGVTLVNNLKNLWWKRFVSDRMDMYGLDSAIITHPKAWVASGHVDGFNDPLVEDLKTHKRYRADHILEDNNIDPTGMTVDQMSAAISENKVLSPDKNPLGEVKAFNMMFSTQVGPIANDDSVAYLRPETAGGIFLSYKNVLDTMNPKIPFGIGQIGKAFRNEIAPRDFIFRVRELEQMEVEYFINPTTWEEVFEMWKTEMWEYIKEVGIDSAKTYELDVPEEDRAHYSKKTIDFEFEYPFGRKELYGLAYRTDYDLSSHAKASGAKLEYIDQQSGERYIPHVIEPSLGVGRTLLAVLTSAYTEDEMGGEKRVYLKLKPAVAPVKVAVFPLLKNKPELVEKAKDIFAELKKEIGDVMFDDNGNVGKRYRRQDEIGTPFCITVDFESLEGQGVTVRNRDTGEQERIKTEDLLSYLKEKLA